MRTIEPYTPIQYIMGTTQFCGFDLAVDDRVFIPRPETELLVDEAARLARSSELGACRMRILDLCTGSGNIAIALTKQVPDCKIVASDISSEALEIAGINAETNGVSDKIDFVKSDLFEGLRGKFDIIVSNPPYIAGREFDALQKEVLREPRTALYGGPDGLDFYRRIAAEAPRFLQKGGAVMVEIGYAQKREVSQLFEDEAFKIDAVIKDHNDIERVIVARWISS